MLIAHESPISIIEKVACRTDYCYALVHLFETHPAYYEFFKNSIHNHKEVLLDNSIFELGTAFDSGKFAEYVQDLSPSFYIVPDVLEDGYQTISKFGEFRQEYPNLPGLAIGVVQGTTYDELCDCYRYMSDNADYIAISFDYSYYIATGRGTNKLQRWCDGRRRFIRSLVSDGIWDWDKPHHLLGASLPQEFKHYKDIDSIRSVDTSNPVVAGIKGLKYSGQLGLNTKPSIKLVDLIDHKVTDDEMEIINYNINRFRGIVHDS